MSRPPHPSEARTQVERLAAAPCRAAQGGAEASSPRNRLRRDRHGGDRARARKGDARRALPSLRGQTGVVRCRGRATWRARSPRRSTLMTPDGRSAESPHRRDRRLPRCLPRPRGAAHLSDSTRPPCWAGIAWREIDAPHGVRSLREGVTAMLAERPDDALAVEPTTFLLAGAFNEAALWIAEAKDEKPARRAMDRSLAALIERLFVCRARPPSARARASPAHRAARQTCVARRGDRILERFHTAIASISGGSPDGLGAVDRASTGRRVRAACVERPAARRGAGSCRSRARGCAAGPRRPTTAPRW